MSKAEAQVRGWLALREVLAAARSLHDRWWREAINGESFEAFARRIGTCSVCARYWARMHAAAGRGLFVPGLGESSFTLLQAEIAAGIRDIEGTVVPAFRCHRHVDVHAERGAVRKGGAAA